MAKRMNKRKVFEAIAFQEMYWNRAMSHYGIPLTLASHLSVLVLMLKSFNIFSWQLFIPAAALMIVIIQFTGYLDVKFKVYKLVNDLNNKHNPQLMKIWRKIK